MRAIKITVCILVTPCLVLLDFVNVMKETTSGAFVGPAGLILPRFWLWAITKKRSNIKPCPNS